MRKETARLAYALQVQDDALGGHVITENREFHEVNIALRATATTENQRLDPGPIQGRRGQDPDCAMKATILSAASARAGSDSVV
jgi:hypothetical protein